MGGYFPSDLCGPVPHLREWNCHIRQQFSGELAVLPYLFNNTQRRPDVPYGITKLLYRQDAAAHADLWDLIATLDTQAGLLAGKVPALLMVGEQDTSTPVAAVQQLAQALRTPHVHLVPGSAHLTNVEAPDIVNDLLLHFLAFCSTQSGVG